MSTNFEDVKKEVEGVKKEVNALEDDTKSFLEKMQFPTDRKTLLEQAKEIKAPTDVLTFLGRLADKTYESLEDLWESAKKAINH